MNGRDQIVYLDVDGRIILKCNLKEIENEGGGWIHLAQDTTQWWALQNTVINVRVL
jgi:hypothetical protein